MTTIKLASGFFSSGLKGSSEKYKVSLNLGTFSGLVAVINGKTVKFVQAGMMSSTYNGTYSGLQVQVTINKSWTKSKGSGSLLKSAVMTIMD